MSQKVSLLFFASLVFVQGCFTSSASAVDKDVCTQQAIGEITLVSCWEDDGSGRQQFFKEGQLHSEGDLPAQIFYREDGTVEYEEFYKEGKLHREGDLPALTGFWEDGTVMSEWFYKEGKLHRDEGLPAVIGYHTDGLVSDELFYNQGVKYKTGLALYDGELVTIEGVQYELVHVE